MTKEPNGNLAWRTGQLEKRADDTEKDMKAVLQTDLPNINTNMVGLKTRINVLTAINIGAIVLAIILSKVLQ